MRGHIHGSRIDTVGKASHAYGSHAWRGIPTEPIFIHLLKAEAPREFRTRFRDFHRATDRILQSKNKTVSFTTIFKFARGFHMKVEELIDDDLFKRDDLELD